MSEYSTGEGDTKIETDGQRTNASKQGPVVTWAPEEQKLLDQGLKQFPVEQYQPLERYLRISATISNKTARDVAFRVKWMLEQQKNKKRKASAQPVAPSALDKSKLPRTQHSIFAAQSQPAHSLVQGQIAPITGMQAALPGLPPGMMPGAPLGAQMPPPGMPHGMPPGMPAGAPVPFVPKTPAIQLDDHGAQSVGGVGGPVAQLLEQNYWILNQFKGNMQQFRVQENTELLVRFRDNILSILNLMNSMQGVMSQMPPLPVRMNVELANNFLPKAGAPSFFPVGMPFMPGAFPGQPMGAVPVNGYMMPTPVPGAAPPRPGVGMQPANMPGTSMPQGPPVQGLVPGMLPGQFHGMPVMMPGSHPPLIHPLPTGHPPHQHPQQLMPMAPGLPQLGPPVTSMQLPPGQPVAPAAVASAPMPAKEASVTPETTPPTAAAVQSPTVGLDPPPATPWIKQEQQ